MAKSRSANVFLFGNVANAISGAPVIQFISHPPVLSKVSLLLTTVNMHCLLDSSKAQWGGLSCIWHSENTCLYLQSSHLLPLILHWLTLAGPSRNINSFIYLCFFLYYYLFINFLFFFFAHLDKFHFVAFTGIRYYLNPHPITVHTRTLLGPAGRRLNPKDPMQLSASNQVRLDSADWLSSHSSSRLALRKVLVVPTRTLK